MNQLENYDTRYNRINRAMKLIDGKRRKFDNFANTTEMLLRALGMFFKNPNLKNLFHKYRKFKGIVSYFYPS